MPVALSRSVIIFLILILFSAEFFRVYFVMPFPGSQRKETVDLAYWISNHIIWIRISALAFISFALIRVFKQGRTWEKTGLSIAFIGYVVAFWLLNYPAGL